ncbi:hypothetical protein BVG16_16120 [Paenibacillus selenitireducens]|uniref:PpiC domain-containing protein n=1 Tax=Paenibacillus selenitireducens TaxID=1324314 RepID=A0A1T2X9X0_9BACL|nr:peptidylprolyl isomerase [Paenibacillus selenitireducens]OPA76697.1 hypothetical protein BVG16_16120 [Paenibacillus selenitireducens]
MKKLLVQKHRLLIGGMIVILMLVMVVIYRSVALASAEDTVVFTIDNEAIPEEEFRLFLQQNKALTTSYFKRKYNVDYGDGFWTTTYHGENPMDYVRQKTVEDLKKIKIEQMLMKEHGVLQDVSFATFLKQLDSENDERQLKLRNQQPIYGPKTYRANEFYSYTQSNNYQRLIDTLVKQRKDTLSDEILKPLYEEVKSSYFHQGYVFEYEKITAPTRQPLEEIQQQVKMTHQQVEDAVAAWQEPAAITVERETLDIDEKSKDDDRAQYLQELFQSMQAGDFTEAEESDDGVIVYRLLATKDKGYEPYDQVKAALIQIYVQKQLEQEVQRRLSDANIQIHEEVMKRISFT